MDDNSSDDSREVVSERIRRYPDRRISLVVNHNGPSGTPTPINMGIRQMRGDYFAWLSSDDIFEPEKLEAQIRVFETRPEVAMVHTAFTTIDDRGLQTGSFFPPGEFESDAFSALLDGNFINGNTSLIRREVLEDIGPFLETDTRYPDLWRAAEYYYWLKIAWRFPIHCIPLPLHRARRHPGNADYNGGGMGSALERMLIRRFFTEHDVHITPEMIVALSGRGLASLALEFSMRMQPGDRERTLAFLAELEADQESWDIGCYEGVRKLDNGRIRSAFRAATAIERRAMLQAVAQLERPQTGPYRKAALARLAKMDADEKCHA